MTEDLDLPANHKVHNIKSIPYQTYPILTGPLILKSSMMLLALKLTSIIACSLAARGFQLRPRGGQTLAICTSDFAWADNSLGDSPCQVATNLDALCNSGNWIIPATDPSAVYAVPSGPKATFCTCSWASYNLISACQACQGFPEQISSWGPYSINCLGKLSDPSYFPSNLTLPKGTLIPAWATNDPKNWANQRFDTAAAKNISSKGISDFGAPSPPSKSTPTGAIVGGVVGGVILLLVAILIGIYIFRRTSRPSNNGGPPSIFEASRTHLRSLSDLTANSNNMSTPIGYTSLSSTPMNALTNPTIKTHGTSSVRSFPFSSAGSTAPFSPSVRQSSLRQQSPSPVSMRRDETAVEPFMLPPSNVPTDRKQANGAYPVYDPPTAPPVAMHVQARSTTPTQGGRTRFNPPEYTEQTKASPEGGGSSSRRPHAKKGSADTQHSITSSRSGGHGGAGITRVGGGSFSAMGSQLAPVTPVRLHANASMSAISTGHGRQLSGNTASNTSLNGNGRPNDFDDIISARNIA